MTRFATTLDGVPTVSRSGSYDVPGLDVSQVPRGEVVFDDPEGIVSTLAGPGARIDITRDDLPAFQGIAQGRGRKRGDQDESVSYPLVSLAYHRLRRRQCTLYTYDEDGLPITTRDAVTVNPWKFLTYRAPNGTLDGDGLPQALDGFTPSQVAQALIGAALCHQAYFQDNRWLRPSQVALASNTLQAYRDQATGDVSPFLQRVRLNGTTFRAGGQPIESIPIENSDPNVEAMAALQSVQVLIVGLWDGANDPVLEVTRNARSGARVYATVPLTRTASYLGSGMTAWAGTLDVSALGGDAQNSLGWRIAVPGAQGATTTKVHYLRIYAPLAQAHDGIPYTIAPYYDGPTGLITGSPVWVDDDYQGLDRLTALERNRKGTIADPLLNPSSHWDCWLDTADGHFHFAPRRGSDNVDSYTTGDGRLQSVSIEEQGDALAYQTIAIGAGEGDAEVVVVDRSPTGGLYDADRDPYGGTRLFGDLPRLVVFRDQSIKSPNELRRRARAAHVALRAPTVRFDAKFIPYGPTWAGYYVNGQPQPGSNLENIAFEPGDTIAVAEPSWDLEASFRCVALKHSWSGDGIEAAAGFGEPQPTFETMGRQQATAQQRSAAKPQPAIGVSGMSAPAVHFDTSRYGRVAISIPEGPDVERVFLSMRTVPWQATATAAASTGTAEPINFHQHIADEGIMGPSAFARVTVPFAISGGFAGAIVTLHLFNSTGASVGYDITLTNQTTGNVLASESFNLGDLTLKSFNYQFFAGDVNEGDTLRYNITGNNGTAVGRGAPLGGFAMFIQTFSEHAHSLTYGIFQQGGSNPTYGTNIQFAIDPTVNSRGEPTAFAAQAHPLIWGTSAAPAQVLVDVTNWLSTDAQGRILSGEHLIYLKAGSGLAAVAATPILRLKETGQ